MTKRKIIIFVAIFALLLGACEPKVDEAALTQATMDALYTSVAQTLAVAVPTFTPQPQVTVTPTVTATRQTSPTAPLATATKAATASVCDNAVYVADVTIPDNTAMTPGQTFTKTWEIKNVGTCDWSTAYKLVFLSGEKMGGLATNIGAAIGSGHSDNVSVGLVAPITKGTYTGYWIMQNPSGKTFGASVYVSINVASSYTSTPTLTVTTTPDVYGTGVSGSLTAIAQTAAAVPTETPTPTPSATTGVIAPAP